MLRTNNLVRVTRRVATLAGDILPIVSRFRPSIGVTLTLSFALVATLAVIANLLAQYGGWIITIRDAAPAVTTSLMANGVINTPRNAPLLPEVPATSAISSLPLLSAIERFEQSTLLRIEGDNAEADREWEEALQAMESAGVAFSTQTRLGAPTPDVKRAIGVYVRTGQALIATADSRRAAIVTFGAKFEQLNSRVKSSLDGAWKIFGRVVARQSLLSLNAALDDLRKYAVALTTPPHDELSLNMLHSREAAFMALVDANRRSFINTYGDAWVHDLQSDFAQLIAARETIEKLIQTRAAAQRKLRHAKTSLLATVPSDSAISPIHQSTVISAGNNARPHLATSGAFNKHAFERQQATVFADPSSLIARADEWSFGRSRTLYDISAPISEEEAKKQISSVTSQQRTAVAWLSSAILLALILVSLWTVRSVMLPVTRLVRATRELAMGKQPPPLARAGLKELDSLSIAFNRMSDEIINARNKETVYQQHLESVVVERTNQLQFLAERDPLTLLPNRRQLFVLLNNAIEAARQGHRSVGVMFVDVDNFKNINDSMGHPFGDHILVAIGQRLSATAEPFGFAARLGGDEFLVVYVSAEQELEIHRAGIAVVQAFQQPLLVEGRALHLSVSVGASVFPMHAQDAKGLLQSADAALYRAKALGRSQMNIFTDDLLKTAADKFATEQGLRRAIDAGEFELVFHPELKMSSLRTELVEALIRWRMPDGSLVSPGEFLPVAEESGLICEISEWVMRSAIASASRWHHGAWPEACVAINVSPRQLIDPLFVEKLVALLREYRLPHRCIEIELTETVLQTGICTIETLRALRAHGIATALDDFGTGYSSLSSLEQLPLSRVKLDRSLINSVHTNPRSAAIVGAIVNLCRGLDLAVTAEGIEVAEQFEFLAKYPDICLQGYLFTKPVSEIELPNAMEKISQIAQELILRSSGAGSNSAPVAATVSGCVKSNGVDRVVKTARQ